MQPPGWPWDVWLAVPVTPWLWPSLWEGGALIRFLPALAVCDPSLPAPQRAKRTEASFACSAGGLLDMRKAVVKCRCSLDSLTSLRSRRAVCELSSLKCLGEFFLLCVCAPSGPTLCDPVGCSPPGYKSLAFPRPDSWSGLLFPSPGDLPDPRIELTSLGVSWWILDHWHHLGSSSYLTKEKRNLFYSPSIYCRKRPRLLQAHAG